jgi:hypothetical protein
MTEHYSEAALLETYYTQPGASMPVMMHLASCSECAARYEGLERKLRGLASCESEKPDTFWTRQRMLIMKRIANERPRRAIVTRLAAAALLITLLGAAALLMYTEKYAAKNQTPIHAALRPDAGSVVKDEGAVPRVEDSTDPWESDELEDFSPIVAWESWGDAKQNANGGKSL